MLRRRRLAALLFCILLPLLLLGIARTVYQSLYTAITEQAASNEQEEADVIVIFGAAITSQGRPSPVLSARIQQGLDLYRHGLADNFILTGGIGWAPPAESVVMKRILTASNIPAAAIFLETRSKTSMEQVAFTIKTMKTHGWSEALLVSDPLHMYRLKEFFQKSGVTAYAAPARSMNLSSRGRFLYTQIETLKLLAFYLLSPLLSPFEDVSAPDTKE